MKNVHVSVLALAVGLYCVPAFAQHGQMGGSMGGNMSGRMGHASSHSTNADGSSSSSTKGVTIDQQLSKNTQLASNIQKLTGLNAQDACTGFKNLGQCVAAAHVSKNLGISFGCLRLDMTGTAAPSGTSCPATSTNSKTMSLGKAIQTLDPTVNSNAEAKNATKQANQDLKN
jgi:hypothetical protein